MSADATNAATADTAKPAASPKPAPRPLSQPAAPAAPAGAAAADPLGPGPDDPLNPEEQAEYGRSAISGLLMAVPSWLVSLIVHVMLLIVFALVTFAIDRPQPQMVHVADINRDELEEIDEFELEEQEIEITETTFESATLDDVGMVDFGDITAPDTSLVSDTSAHEDVEVDDIGQLFGDEGIGMSEVGTGTGSTTFFGVRTEGDHFMYVVDNSNSMNNGKFENAVVELMRSVEQLPDDAFFYVIFYSDMAYPLFYPETVPRWVRATKENKYKLRSWLGIVHRCLQTRGEEAMAHAIKLRPDVLYLLGDGAFTDKAVPKTLELKGEVDVTINTLGFNMREEHAKDFERLAKAFGGNFRSVNVAPEMKELSKRMNRPKNNAPNGDWGLRLGKKKKKK